MRLFPAIDIQGGRCVRLRQGDFADSTVFSNDPVEVARRWQEQGARHLHVVDLDGARLGSPQNFDVVRALAEAVDIPVQLGGGIRTVEALELISGSRVARVIVGTGAIGDETFLREALQVWGASLIVAVDAEEGFITTHGWQKRTLVPVAQLAAQLAALGVKEVLYTDVSRDGMMRGMNINAYEELGRQTTLEIIASGGVTTLEDLRAVKALESLGVTGVIAGRALYEGAFTLAEALAVVGTD
ncbi:MAG: 1-(5-phosphoribosyl)-5-((5-phosphoribosylamino)methylideneamino) imidazole-4-carboxamide isomerase [Actinobacteria bacterium ADurb.Bin444]|nr:MAG: 1-(5-phosphoribosyl)-5-((5-phosphoribosylamino)methylideneamino) imidazole-4-carboxamide isomerase [Actinobacteria bacterium ADurb.Bin444]